MTHITLKKRLQQKALRFGTPQPPTPRTNNSPPPSPSSVLQQPSAQDDSANPLPDTQRP